MSASDQVLATTTYFTYDERKMLLEMAKLDYTCGQEPGYCDGSCGNAKWEFDDGYDLCKMPALMRKALRYAANASSIVKAAREFSSKSPRIKVDDSETYIYSKGYRDGVEAVQALLEGER